MNKKRQEMSEGKKNIIASLIEEYDSRTAEDIQNALGDLLGGAIKGMVEAEMEDHLGYAKNERSSSINARKGHKGKTVRSQYGEILYRCYKTGKAALSL